MNGCGITKTKNYFSYNNWTGTNKVEKILKKRKKIRKLVVWNYTSTEFPNETISELINLTDLSINSDSFLYESNLDDYLEIDPIKLSKLERLKRLYVGVFSMNSFPAQIRNENLEELYLEIDKLETLNSDFSNLKKTKKMHLVMRDLKSIGEQTRFPESLNQLVLYSRKLQSISLDSFRDSKIRKVNLWAHDLSDENLIKLIKDFDKMESLEKIVISINDCERKKYLTKIIRSSVRIKYKTIESCNKIL